MERNRVMDQAPEPDDAQVVRWICQDDPQAAVVLLQRYGDRVHGHLRRRFPSLDEADIHDILVDAVLKLLETFDPQRGSPGGWLLFLARRGAVDRLRTHPADSATVSLLAAGQPVDRGTTPLDSLLLAERERQVQAAIASLSGLERAVMEADLEAQSAVPAARLARQLEASESSIYTARHRARQKLALVLGPDLPDEEMGRHDHGPAT